MAKEQERNRALQLSSARPHAKGCKQTHSGNSNPQPQEKIDFWAIVASDKKEQTICLIAAQLSEEKKCTHDIMRFLGDHVFY